MKNFKLYFLILVIGVSLNTATGQAVLQGQVQSWDSQNQSGCSVYLGLAGDTVQTNTQGMFAITGLPVSVQPSLPLFLNQLKVINNQLIFVITKNTSVSYELYDLRGVQISKASLGRLNKGKHRINMLGNDVLTGQPSLYFLSLNIDKTTRIFKIIVDEKGNSLFELKSSETLNTLNNHSSNNELFKKSAPPDTLNLICSGFTPKKILVDNYQQNLGTLTVRPPNFVIMFLDDAGYGDFSTYGQSTYTTPNIDKMAVEGAKFMHFYSTQAACSASRAGLLTGTYPNRFNFPWVLGPNNGNGLHANELTIAELVKQKNYATAAYGKWHVGDRSGALPTHHGFDKFFGIPYSADMWPYHPSGGNWPPLPLIHQDAVVNPAVDSSLQEQLTTLYTDSAVQFITDNKDKPFLIYLAHNQPHVPLFVSDKFKGKSGAGAYGDVIQEIDWSLGQIIQSLKDNGIDEETLVMFTSDNGPWRSYGNHGGFTGPYREEKGTTHEGGVHMAGIFRWPGQINPNTVVNEPAMTIDFLPTIAHLMGGTLPNHPIDGHNIYQAMLGNDIPDNLYLFYQTNNLRSARMGKWKFHYPHSFRRVRVEGNDGRAGSYFNPQPSTDWALYDIENDPGEATNLRNSQSAVFDSLRTLFDAYQTDLQANRRPVGRY